MLTIAEPTRLERYICLTFIEYGVVVAKFWIEKGSI
jgi:hypothetical protein